jgi:hypothetical protein
MAVFRAAYPESVRVGNPFADRIRVSPSLVKTQSGLCRIYYYSLSTADKALVTTIKTFLALPEGSLRATVPNKLMEIEQRRAIDAVQALADSMVAKARDLDGKAGLEFEQVASRIKVFSDLLGSTPYVPATTKTIDAAHAALFALGMRLGLILENIIDSPMVYSPLRAVRVHVERYPAPKPEVIACDSSVNLHVVPEHQLFIPHKRWPARKLLNFELLPPLAQEALLEARNYLSFPTGVGLLLGGGEYKLRTSTIYKSLNFLNIFCQYLNQMRLVNGNVSLMKAFTNRIQAAVREAFRLDDLRKEEVGRPFEKMIVRLYLESHPEAEGLSGEQLRLLCRKDRPFLESIADKIIPFSMYGLEYVALIEEQLKFVLSRVANLPE